MGDPVQTHVLVLPSELYCPPGEPLAGIFQRHQVELLAGRGLKIGVVSFGWISWRRLLSSFPYQREETQGAAHVMRCFERPLLPPRMGGGFLKHRLVAGYRNLVDTYIQRYGKPDLLHAHNVFHAGLAACRIGADLGLPVVLTEHSSALMGDGLGREAVEDVREVLGGVTALSAVGSSLARRLESLRPAGVVTPCSVLGNLLDPFIERVSARAAVPDRGRKNFCLLAVGGLIPVKNHSLLLRAFAKAFGRDPLVQLRIGGTGPLAQSLREEARDLGVDSQVAFLGHLDRERVVAEMEGCDALVSTSRVETFGVVLIEAMAFGKPVVATRCGGPEDFVDEGQGLLADTNVDSVASALQAIRACRYDPQAIRAHCIGRFGADAFFARLMALYALVLGRPMASRTEGES